MSPTNRVSAPIIEPGTGSRARLRTSRRSRPGEDGQARPEYGNRTDDGISTGFTPLTRNLAMLIRGAEGVNCLQLVQASAHKRTSAAGQWLAFEVGA